MAFMGEKAKKCQKFIIYWLGNCMKHISIFPRFHLVFLNKNLLLSSYFKILLIMCLFGCLTNCLLQNNATEAPLISDSINNVEKSVIRKYWPWQKHFFRLFILKSSHKPKTFATDAWPALNPHSTPARDHLLSVKIHRGATPFQRPDINRRGLQPE